MQTIGGDALPYGTAVRGEDIEKRAGADPASWLTQLFRSILQAAIAREDLQYLVPEVTDKVTTRDGGVDAALEVTLGIAAQRQPGIVNPGETIYQIKWRSRASDAVPAARGELAKVLAAGRRPDVYVFITNLVLTIERKHQIVDALTEGTNFPPDSVVVLGGSDIADRVNDDPRIRVAHFGISASLTTLYEAANYAERRYRREGNRPTLLGREEEIGAIKRFARNDGRVMIVSGPPAAGKSRAVQEGLSEIPERVVWSRGVPPHVGGLLQMLDDSPAPSILVIDDADEGVDAALRAARETRQVKTVLVTVHPITVVGAERLRIETFDHQAGERLVEQLFPGIPAIHRRWLVDQFGGAPGLLVQAGFALASTSDRDPLSVPAYDSMMDEYERRMTRGLGDAARTLQAFSILSRFSTRLADAPDLDAISRAVGSTRAEALKNLEILRGLGLLEEAGWPGGGIFRVIPPLLARRIARRVLLSLAEDLSTLFTALSPEGQAALVRRVGETRGDGGPLDQLIRWLIEESGMFSDVASASASAAVVRGLAETMPRWVATELRRLIEATGRDELRDVLTGDSRREMVRALESLLRNSDTFDDAARILLLLAEAENESWANNAGGVFVEAFHSMHPEIPRDARLRARLLGSLAGDPVPERRELVANAAAHALQTHFIVMRLSDERPLLPELGWPTGAKSEEVHDTLRRTSEVLLRLAVDSNSAVRHAAIGGFARGIHGLLSTGLWDEALTGLESLQRVVLEGEHRSEVVGAVASLASTLRNAITEKPERKDRKDLESVIRNAEDLFTRLTAGDFSARLQHWLGPSPITRSSIGDDAAEYGEIFAEATRLAGEVVDNPELLTEDLRRWVSGEYAYTGGQFLHALGKTDAERRLLPAWEAEADQPRGATALGLYIAGWMEAEPAAASIYLDALVDRRGFWMKAAVEATLRCALTPAAVERLIRCVGTGEIDREVLSRSLVIARWGLDLDAGSFTRFLETLRDGSPEVDWALLEPLHVWMGRRPGDSNALIPLAMTLLSNTTAERPQGQWGYRWDGLAAAVAEHDLGRGFELLMAHLDSEGRNSPLLVRDRARLLARLSSADRAGVVRTLLAAARSLPSGGRVRVELPWLMNIATDAPTMLDFATREGLEGARLLSGSLDGGQSGFWAVGAQLLDRWGDDEEVREGILLSAVTIRHAHTDEAGELKPRLEPVSAMTKASNVYVADTARQAKEILERMIRRAEGA